MSNLVVEVPVREGLAVFVGEAAAGDHDEVDERADAKEPSRKQPQDAGSGLADVEAVDA